jgi:hypothetical protein
MYGPRVLEWKFENINLPDSTTDLEGSNGFVTFHVEQNANLEPGTQITNAASIYFDFNEPVITNTTMHRIFEGFVSVLSLEENSKKDSRILVYPNPTAGQFTISLDKSADSDYVIFDQLGRFVKTGLLIGPKTNISLDVESGIYYLMVGERVAKLQVMK